MWFSDFKDFDFQPLQRSISGAILNLRPEVCSPNMQIAWSQHQSQAGHSTEFYLASYSIRWWWLSTGETYSCVFCKVCAGWTYMHKIVQHRSQFLSGSNMCINNTHKCKCFYDRLISPNASSRFKIWHLLDCIACCRCRFQTLNAMDKTFQMVLGRYLRNFLAWLCLMFHLLNKMWEMCQLCRWSSLIMVVSWFKLKPARMLVSYWSSDAIVNTRVIKVQVEDWLTLEIMYWLIFLTTCFCWQQRHMWQSLLF